jgi:hypothetical protein
MSGSIDTGALQFATNALRAALWRHHEARARSDLDDAYASAAETVWWVCAIDEHLCTYGGNSAAYEARRDADTNGRYVAGMRWIRDRHTHQMPITADTDKTSFFGPPGILDISQGVIWRPSQQIRIGTHPNANKKRSRDERAVYDRLMAGHGTSGALMFGCQWIEGETGLDCTTRVTPRPSYWS